jgi:hypothetical protein
MQMGRRGRTRQRAVEDQYWALTLSGVGTVAACRPVGITRKAQAPVGPGDRPPARPVRLDGQP